MTDETREIDEAGIRQRWEQVGSKLDERGRRLWAASAVQAAGHGALKVVSRITGLAHSTINRGEDDLDEGPLPDGRVRRKGSGGRPLTETEGSRHPDRNAQFEHINAKGVAAQAKGEPVISVDTKKKELVGNYKNTGSDYRPLGQPVRVNVHDFADKELGKAVPYGVYDVAANEAFVSVGIAADTAEFAVAAIRSWRERMGLQRYPRMRELTITADCGGSNGARVRLWKVELQKLADETGLTLHVHHYPPGTSKWNKIEHRLFCYITQNWRGRPLTDRAAVVELIGATTTESG